MAFNAPDIGLALSSVHVPPESTVPLNNENKSKFVLLKAASFLQNGGGLFGVPVFGTGLIMILTTTSTSSHETIGSISNVKS